MTAMLLTDAPIHELIHMRVDTAILLTILLASTLSIPALAADYAPVSLVATVYPDGVVDVEYIVDTDPLAVRVTVPLFGTDFPDLLVVNQDGLPLVTAQAGPDITVDSLGATSIAITYSTQELTSKLGTLWALNVTLPTNLEAWLPAGATIVGMSQMPLGVTTIGGRIQVIMPPGANSVSYVVSSSVTREAAQTAITDAETTIDGIKANGTITTAAESLLAQAEAAFNAGDYTQAAQMAAQAKTSALTTEAMAQSALDAIERATTEIQNAKDDGRTSHVAAAETSLGNAETSYASGDYAAAKTSADQAYEQARASSRTVDYTLIIAGVAILLVAAGAYAYTLRSRAPPPPPKAAPKSDDGAVNLESVFQKHPDLRVDDREVIRFLAERGGEAFANEIRDRFDIPRTSAWRMIRRLISAGVVEERKIGGQSLIYVAKRYREAKKE